MVHSCQLLSHSSMFFYSSLENKKKQKRRKHNDYKLKDVILCSFQWFAIVSFPISIEISFNTTTTENRLHFLCTYYFVMFRHKKISVIIFYSFWASLPIHNSQFCSKLGKDKKKKKLRKILLQIVSNSWFGTEQIIRIIPIGIEILHY